MKTRLLPITAAAVCGAVAAFAPTAPGATAGEPRPALAAAATCTATGWQSTLTLTNPTRSPVTVDTTTVDGAPTVVNGLTPGDLIPAGEGVTGIIATTDAQPSMDIAVVVSIGWATLTLTATTVRPTCATAPIPTGVPATPTTPSAPPADSGGLPVTGAEAAGLAALAALAIAAGAILAWAARRRRLRFTADT